MDWLEAELQSSLMFGCMHALRENALLPCVKIFVVRFLSGTRQRASLPRILYRAQGKEKCTVNNSFAVRFLDAWQTQGFVVRFL
jgi:hypothetical protein